MPALPSGTILLWSGSIASIPSGFVLCDGTLGTPDLRDRFVVGAGLTYAVDASGGSTQHNHDFTSDTHRHTILPGNDIASGANFDDKTSFDTVSGTTDNKEHLPPYYALAYIMKT